MKITVVDSYAWIENFRGSDKGKVASDSLQECEQAIMPDVVLAEIGRKYAREGFREDTVRRRLRSIVESSLVSEIATIR